MEICTLQLTEGVAPTILNAFQNWWTLSLRDHLHVLICQCKDVPLIIQWGHECMIFFYHEVRLFLSFGAPFHKWCFSNSVRASCFEQPITCKSFQVILEIEICTVTIGNLWLLWAQFCLYIFRDHWAWGGHLPFGSRRIKILLELKKKVSHISLPIHFGQKSRKRKRKEAFGVLLAPKRPASAIKSLLHIGGCQRKCFPHSRAAHLPRA